MEVFGKFCQAAAAEDPAASLLQEAAQVTLALEILEISEFFPLENGMFYGDSLELLEKISGKNLKFPDFGHQAVQDTGIQVKHTEAQR